MTFTPEEERSFFRRCVENRAAIHRYLWELQTRWQCRLLLVEHPRFLHDGIVPWGTPGEHYWVAFIPTERTRVYPPRAVTDEWRALLAQALRLRTEAYHSILGPPPPFLVFPGSIQEFFTRKPRLEAAS